MNTLTYRKKILIIAIILISVIASIFCGADMPQIAYANDVAYSNVLDDLKKDSSFDVNNYPKVENDYSLKLIQIAESVSNDLFLYVYQPSGQTKNLIASSINISTTINDAISFRNYKLQRINSSGVIFKYLVKNFKVVAAPARYYAISSIYRPFDATIDKQAENGNTITEVNYPVNKQYCLSIANGKPYCSVVDTETIVVTDKFVGFVRYSNGIIWNYNNATDIDSHFVAFNTDKPIDKLLEANVYFTKQSYEWNVPTTLKPNGSIFGAKEDDNAYLKYTDKVEHTGEGFLAATYKWDRIETVSQFIKENDLTQNVYAGALIDVNVANKITNEGEEALKNKKWLLRFKETDYKELQRHSSIGPILETYHIESTIVGDVTILRLKFETDGVTYNLGVIDNKQSGSDKPINKEDINVKPNKNFKWLFIILLILLCIVIFAPILPYLFRFIFWLIKTPFTAVYKSIKNYRARKKARLQKKADKQNKRKLKPKKPLKVKKIRKQKTNSPGSVRKL